MNDCTPQDTTSAKALRMARANLAELVHLLKPALEREALGGVARLELALDILAEEIL